MFEQKENGLFIATPERLKELKDKEQVPLRIDALEQENADLWYDNMLKDAKIEQSEAEVALLWYEIMQMGGA